MAMLPPIRKARPPNMRFSVSAFSPRISSRIRAARISSYATRLFSVSLTCARRVRLGADIVEPEADTHRELHGRVLTRWTVVLKRRTLRERRLGHETRGG